MIPLLLLLAVGGLMQAARSFTSDITAGGTELAFGYMLLSAYFAAKIAGRLGLPKLTGYLLAGIISGQYVLQLVSSDMGDSLKIVNGVATCILGLTAGAELNIKRIKPVMATLRAITFFGVIGAMFALTGLLFMIRPLLPLFNGMTTIQALAVCGVIGVALSAQSPAVAMALLAETKADGPLSQLMLATVVVADLVVILFYSIVSAGASAVIGGDVAVLETISRVVWELFGSLAFGVAIGMLLGLFLKHVKGGASLFALMVCVVVAEIGTHIHLDPLLVMLAAGIWLENFSRADASSLLHGFEAAELPVYLVWFALAGSNLNLGQLWTTLIPVIILAAARAGVFFVGARFACAATHAPPQVTRYSWTGLVPQAGLSLALVVVIRQSFKSFGPEASVLLLSVVALNQLLSPVLLRIALVRSGEAGKRATADFAVGH